MITCIDYFAGIGAWELATEILKQIYGYQVFTTYQFVEILPSAQQVLRSHYPLIPIHSDIKLGCLTRNGLFKICFIARCNNYYIF